jgi:hypothetical protein
MNWFTILRAHLADPEYLHVLINPLPVYGLAIATLGLVLALFLRNQRVTIAALVLVFVSALSAWPTYYYGEEGYDRVKALSDAAGEQWLDEHMARGEKLIWAFYVLAGVSALGVGAVVKWPRSSFAISVLALVLGSATLGIGGYIAYAGGHVRHREFRFEPPPQDREEEHRHNANEAAADHDGAHDKHAEGQQAKPMDHGSMPGMEASKSPEPQDHAKHDAAEQPAAPNQEQLEASRMQLEASRLQLEASRKQLEATEAAKGKDASPAPSATPSPQAEEGRYHEPRP